MPIFTISVSGNGARAILEDKDDLFVARGVTIASDNGQAVVSTGATSSGHHAIVEGSVISQAEGLVLGRGTATATRSSP